MNKFVALIALCALTLGVVSCKKDETTNKETTPATNGNGDTTPADGSAAPAENKDAPANNG